MKRIFLLILLNITVLMIPAIAQDISDAAIAELVKEFRKDPRGPYQAIRWFCPDGRVLPPQERCNQPGAIQHALHKNIVQKIATERHIFLGQILAGTPTDEFLDRKNLFSRAKQYQIEQFLKRVDDGWILRRARFYRGAIQQEDESAWADQFLTKLCNDSQFVSQQFFMLRQWVKDLPHEGIGDRWDNIRAVSKILGDSLPSFMDLRVKLHGEPEPGDIKLVKNYRDKNLRTLKPDMLKKFDELISDLETAFKPFDLKMIERHLTRLTSESPISEQMRKVLNYNNLNAEKRYTLAFIEDVSELIWRIRIHLHTIKRPAVRFQMLSLSVKLEREIFQASTAHYDDQPRQLLSLVRSLAKAAAGCGYLEIWEYEQLLSRQTDLTAGRRLTLEELLAISEDARRSLEWGVGMFRTHYTPDVERFAAFEHMAVEFIDDRIRSAILLPLGNMVSKIREFTANQAGISNNILDIHNQGQVQGLNPGFAMGELVVIPGSPDEVEFSSAKIYAIQRPPADLKPVAGILTVSEGNLVSHVQLLARNLGIPNAVLSSQNLQDLMAFNGQPVFYAVSPRGAVTIKPVSKMNPAEKALFDVRKRSEDMVRVPIDRLDLSTSTLIDLRQLRSTDSGRLSGPKAANLGELKHLFPDRVVEGFAIPFGIFRRHFDQQMPEKSMTYWQYLQDIFEQANLQKSAGAPSEDVEKEVLLRLTELREAIKVMPLQPEFVTQMRQAFLRNFGKPIGDVPVFIRSDTNMEDLKDFTGAGLNLTVFNVVDEAKIFQGIRDVWASPYSERSYSWRQKYLLNPENVYPSILILPTVDVEKSGVMITTGVSGGDSRDVTVAFSRGAGGAVEGQAAESYLLRSNGENMLLSPARELRYTLLPASGGTQKGITALNKPLLKTADLQQLRKVAEEVRLRLRDEKGAETSGPQDIELGFKDDHIWLFQVRPFVENKRAKSSAYLRSLDPELNLQKAIEL